MLCARIDGTEDRYSYMGKNSEVEELLKRAVVESKRAVSEEIIDALSLVPIEYTHHGAAKWDQAEKHCKECLKLARISGGDLYVYWPLRGLEYPYEEQSRYLRRRVIAKKVSHRRLKRRIK